MATQPIFYVLDNDGNYVAATFATDGNGNPIKDPNWGKSFYGNDGTYSVINSSNKFYTLYNESGSSSGVGQNVNGYLIAPVDYNLNDQINRAKNELDGIPVVQKEALFLTYFAPGSDGDLQQTYDGGAYGNSFVRAFTNVGAFNYGVVAAAGGISPDLAYGQAGAVNLIKSFSIPSIDTSGYLWSPVRNTISIEQGYKYYNLSMPGSQVYDLSAPESYEDTRQHSESDSPYNGDDNVKLINYLDGSSSLIYSNIDGSQGKQILTFSGPNATGKLGVDASSYADGSSAVWGVAIARGQTAGVYYGLAGSVAFASTQIENLDGTSTIVIGTGSGGTSVTTSSIVNSQMSYNGDGSFTFGSPQADPDGLVNRLNVNGTFGTSGLVVTDPTTGVTATVPLVNGSATTLREGRSVASDLPNEQVVSTQANGQVDDAIIGAGSAANLSNAVVTIEPDTIASVTGNANTIALAPNAADQIDVSGTGATLTGNSGSDLVLLDDTGTSATVHGDGFVDLLASGQMLTLNNAGASINTFNDLSGLTVNGSGDTFDQGSDVYADPDDDDPSFFLIMIRRVSRPCHLTR